jgi:predicted TIM-barrel fold metal-dependent hydrolase
MVKRRDFFRKSLIGTAGIAMGGMAFNCKSPDSSPTSAKNSPLQKDWHTDPEWNKIKYGEWGGPGVSAGPGPMDTILLKDYAPRSSVISTETFVPKARYPAIDCHIHVVANTPQEVAEWVKTMDEVGLDKSIVLTEATGAAFDALIELFPRAHPGRFLLFCGIDMSDIDKPDYSERVVAELVRCHKKGASGVGEVIDKGFGIAEDPALPRDKRLHIDDSRLEAFWEKCAELKMPVNLHVADHPSCWTPLDVYQERSPDYQHFNMYGKDVPSYGEMISMRNRIVEKHPKTIFIACHLGNQGHDLANLGLALDKYQNLYLDISARDYEIGRTPRASAKFLIKYQNRVFFGTDQSREKSLYQIHWRLLESADEYFVGRVGWRYYGLELPDQVLKAIYRGNATRMFNLPNLG